MWGTLLTDGDRAELNPLRDADASPTSTQLLADFHQELLRELVPEVETEVRVGTDEGSHFDPIEDYIYLNTEEALGAPDGRWLEQLHASFWHELAHLVAWGPTLGFASGTSGWFALQLLEDIRVERLLLSMAADPDDDPARRWLRFNVLNRLRTSDDVVRAAGELGWADVLSMVCGREVATVITAQESTAVTALAPQSAPVQGIEVAWRTYALLAPAELRGHEARQAIAELGAMIDKTRP